MSQNKDIEASIPLNTIATRVLQRTTTLVDGAKDIEMTRQQWMRTILPIGALFSGSLILSNYAYLTLSVSFIQMLKAFNPVAILLISFAFKIQEPNGRLIIIVLRPMVKFNLSSLASSANALHSHSKLPVSS
ncbi:hypothetical protein J002_03660 [Cryptococcus neoformans]|nr:hypothetical protein J004_03768 [Cryptococcus neoformans var. grubii]OXH54069.1 hypothetical protein J002_03660 [Cryptococcus neoformans var. grubii]